MSEELNWDEWAMMHDGLRGQCPRDSWEGTNDEPSPGVRLIPAPGKDRPEDRTLWCRGSKLVAHPDLSFTWIAKITIGTIFLGIVAAWPH